MELIESFVDKYLAYVPSIKITDIIEIIIISFLVYHIMVWIKNTKAWVFVKGVIVIMIFILIAGLFEMNTILWIAQNVFMYGAFGLLVILQPELRKALEQLGKREFLPSILSFESAKRTDGLFSDKTIHEISKACVEMGKVKTGALIVVAQHEPLTEYERTGIEVDGLVTSQLLINIFEHNTPLHDGAVIVKGDRITSATCYLPLSDNMSLSKELGTRHRAGVGISEVTDSMTVIVSEETGKISVAFGGTLTRDLSAQGLEELLKKIQNKTEEEKERKLWKGWPKNEKTK